MASTDGPTAESTKDSGKIISYTVRVFTPGQMGVATKVNILMRKKKDSDPTSGLTGNLMRANG